MWRDLAKFDKVGIFGEILQDLLTRYGAIWRDFARFPDISQDMASLARI